MVKGEAGVAHILGDFEDERHHYIVMVRRGRGAAGRRMLGRGL